jgi:tagatose-6-phosphate ketose/aldose isomerase
MSLRELIHLDDVEKRRRGIEFTPREIAQQPVTWRDTFRVCTRMHGALDDLLSSAGIHRRRGDGDSPCVVLSGAGTSAYAGACVESLFRKNWECETRVLPSTDLVSHDHDLLVPGRKYFFISFSRSGMSPESVAIVGRLAKDFPSARHLVVTCNADGLMAHEFAKHPRVLCLVLDDAVNDRALAMTSSFSNMVVAAQYVASLREPAAYGEILEEMSESAERFLEKAASAAERQAGSQCARVCFLGSGALNGVARESALKVLEMTAGRVPTVAESFLGIRHGPLAFIDRETLVVAYLSAERRRRGYELDLLEELRKKKLAQSIVAVSRNDDAPTRALVDDLLTLDTDELADDFRPPVDVGLGQLLGLFLSIREGLLPDAPSASGAISRVVSGVRIH